MESKHGKGVKFVHRNLSDFRCSEHILKTKIENVFCPDKSIHTKGDFF